LSTAARPRVRGLSATARPRARGLSATARPGARRLSATSTSALRRGPTGRWRIRRGPNPAGSRVVIFTAIGVGVVITTIGIAVMVCVWIGGRGSIIAGTVMTTTRVGARTPVGVALAVVVLWHCIEWV
jgi:hypothetical protein